MVEYIVRSHPTKWQKHPSQPGAEITVRETGVVHPKSWVPHNYQRRAMKWLLEHACAALWLDPGLGKTSIVLGAYKVLRNEGVVRKMVVLAPLRPCYLVWPAQRDEWREFNQLTMAVLHGPSKEKLLYSDSDIYVVNYEGLEWLTGPLDEKARRSPSRLEYILDGDKQAILAPDEVTKLKHTNTKRFKTLKPWLNVFGRRWTLTGTPAPNGYMDLFGQIYVADQGAALGRYITHYRNQYFDAGGYGNYTFTLREGADVEIQAKLKPLVLRMAAEDYLELPQLLFNPIYLELPAEARRIYDELEEEMFAYITDTEIVSAMSAAAASSKCRQVANGALYLQPKMEPDMAIPPRDEKKWADIHDEKIKAMLDLKEELQGKPLFIAYDFNHDLAKLRTALGKDVPVLGGRGSGPAGLKYDKMVEEAWNRNELEVLLGHPAGVGHGLNLQKSQCADILFFADTWDQELYDQFIRRVRRQGSTQQRVRVHHLIMRSTVDEVVYASHGRKGGLQKALMDALGRRRAKGRKQKK